MDPKELNELKLQAGRMYAAGEKVIMSVKQLRADKKGHYAQPFIFKKKVSRPMITSKALCIRTLSLKSRMKWLK